MTQTASPEISSGDGEAVAATTEHDRLAKRVALPIALSVAVFLAATAGALVAGTLGGTVYGAQVDILFQPPDSVTEIERQLLTQQTLLTSDAVLQPVAARAGMDVAALRDSQSVSLLTNTQVFRVTVGSDTPGSALALAEAIAERYLETLHDGAPRALGDGWVISGPEALARPLHPQPVQSAAIGALAGLVLAAATAFLAVTLQNRA